MSTPLAVLGGGIAGSAAAILLARAGQDVTLVERHTTARDKVCGEFLSQEAIDFLQQLGIDVFSLGAVPIDRVRLHCGRHSAETHLGFRAASLTRRCLDEVLLQQAGASGVRVLRGAHVQDLTFHQGQWNLQLAVGTTLQAETVFCANGKHDLRGHPRPQTPQSGMVAFKQYFHLRHPEQIDGTTQLFLYPGGYAGLQPVEGHRANLCLVIRSSLYRSLGSRWQDLMTHLRRHAPALDHLLSGSQPLLEKPLALSSIPYGYLRNTVPPHGLWPLGDQMAVIPSLTGDGMSIALYTAFQAAQHYLSGQTSAAYTTKTRQTLRGQMHRATTLSRLLQLPAAARAATIAASLAPSLLRQAAALTRLPLSVSQSSTTGAPPSQSQGEFA